MKNNVKTSLKKNENSPTLYTRKVLANVFLIYVICFLSFKTSLINHKRDSDEDTDGCGQKRKNFGIDRKRNAFYTSLIFQHIFCDISRSLLCFTLLDEGTRLKNWEEKLEDIEKEETD